MPRRLRIALVGQRFMGRAHANAWRQAGPFFDPPLSPVLHTVAGRDARALKAFARRWGWERATTDWRVIADDPEVDLVDVAASNDLHAEVSLAMLEAGKHVACEKPLARTLEEARAMREAARGRRKPSTFVWFTYRRCPAVALARQLVREGRLGRIAHVRARYLQSWGGKDAPFGWRFHRGTAGSGAHGDLNAHMVDLARFLTGEEVVEVHGAASRTFHRERRVEGSRRRARSDVDDATLFLASLSGGALASFEATRVATGRLNANEIELNGEMGALRFAFEDMNALSFFDATLPRRTQGWRRIVCTSAEGKHPWAEAWWPDEHPLGYEHGFVNMAADVLRALAGRRVAIPLPDFEDGYQVQRVLEAALLAARERAGVKLSGVR